MMAKTKRPLDASAEATAAAPDATEPSKKRPRSDMPMERKKKRKELDKERHRSSTGEPKSKTSASEPSEGRAAASSASSSYNGLPEFHISVFGDLASSDVSKRFNAAETLVRELEEVQKAYEGLGRKEVVEGGVKLEAEKDDGLDDCAPSVRYAVRRLIRGVSSSREV